MNLVIAGNFTFPSGSASGARIRNLALGLRECGANVHVLSMAPHIIMDIKSQKSSIQWYKGISYELMGSMSSRNYDYNSDSNISLNIIKKVRKGFIKIDWLRRLYRTIIPTRQRLGHLIVMDRCDFFIGYGRNFSMLFPLSQICQKFRIPCLLDIVELYNSFPSFGGPFNPIFWDWKMGTSLLPNYFNGVITITNGLKELYLKRGIKNILVVPAIEGWEDLNEPASKFTFNPFKLLYVGSLTSRDSPSILFDAMRILVRRHLSIQLNIIGRYESISEGRHFASIAQNDPLLRDVVRFLGEISDQELQRHLRCADGLILTRRNAQTEIYSFPTRLVEYLKVGIPVFVSRVGDIPLYLRHMQDAVLISPDDPESIADSVVQLVNCPDRAKTIGLQGRSRGKECFNRQIYANRIIEFAKELKSKCLLKKI